MVTLFEEACNKENFDMETAEFHTLLSKIINILNDF